MLLIKPKRVTLSTLSIDTSHNTTDSYELVSCLDLQLYNDKSPVKFTLLCNAWTPVNYTFPHRCTVNSKNVSKKKEFAPRHIYSKCRCFLVFNQSQCARSKFPFPNYLFKYHSTDPVKSTILHHKFMLKFCNVDLKIENMDRSSFKVTSYFLRFCCTFV